MFNGIIISDSAPSGVTGYAWVKVNEDGSRGWYGFNKDTQQWELENTEAAPAILAHTHTSLENLEITDTVRFSGSVYAEDKKGESAEIVIPGVGTLKFKHGIMHNFSPV